MSLDLYWRFLLALVFVVALIALLAWLARRFGLAGRGFVPGGRRRLSIVEIAPLDGKRRLVLVRRDDVEHLLLVGETALVVERDIRVAPAASGEFAAALRDSEALQGDGRPAERRREAPRLSEPRSPDPRPHETPRSEPRLGEPPAGETPRREPRLGRRPDTER